MTSTATSSVFVALALAGLGLALLALEGPSFDSLSIAWVSVVGGIYLLYHAFGRRAGVAALLLFGAIVPSPFFAAICMRFIA